MLLLFALAYVNFSTRSFISTSTQDGDTSFKDLVYTLTYKVLNIPIFSKIDLLMLKFKKAMIFQLDDKILEGKVRMSSLYITKVITKPLTEDDLVKLQIKLASKTIVIFNKGHLKEINISLLFEIPLAICIIYLLDVSTRST